MKLVACSLLFLLGSTCVFSASFTYGVTVYTNRDEWKAPPMLMQTNLAAYHPQGGQVQISNTGPEIEKLLNGQYQLKVVTPGYTGGVVVQESGRSFRDTLHPGDLDQFDLSSAGDFALGADVTLKRGLHCRSLRNLHCSLDPGMRLSPRHRTETALSSLA